ncbi:MAG TPA: hypothetical protein VNM90_18890 [Haliangium sp.]|nr:hypothetical protein [Haliangium sp.]
MLWRDPDPAGQPALLSARAQAVPVEPSLPGSGASLAPRPSLDRAIAARSPEHLPYRAPETASGARASGGADDIAVTRELVRASLAQDLPRKLPELALSAGELEQLTDAVLRVREHRALLRGLAHTRDNAAELRRLEEQLVRDLLVFEEVTGMSATELTGALSDEGLTTEEQAHAEKPVYWTLPE